MRFGLQDGWDFSRASLDELDPDEVYMSPERALWSRTPQINVHNEA